MVEMLVSRRKNVKIYLQTDPDNYLLIGRIDKLYKEFNLIRVHKLLLPLELIAKIEILPEELPA